MKKIIISDTEKDSIRQMHESFKQNERVFLNENDFKPETTNKKAIQCFLNKKGIKDNSGNVLDVDGSIGTYPASKTAQAIYKYQQMIGAPADGVWGEETMNYMKGKFETDKNLFNKCKSETGGFFDKVMGVFK